jgi:hypothetical protein
MQWPVSPVKLVTRNFLVDVLRAGHIDTWAGGCGPDTQQANCRLAPGDVVGNGSYSTPLTVCGAPTAVGTNGRNLLGTETSTRGCPSRIAAPSSIRWPDRTLCLAAEWSPTNPFNAWDVRPHSSTSIVPEWICAKPILGTYRDHQTPPDPTARSVRNAARLVGRGSNWTTTPPPSKCSAMRDQAWPCGTRRSQRVGVGCVARRISDEPDPPQDRRSLETPTAGGWSIGPWKSGARRRYADPGRGVPRSAQWRRLATDLAGARDVRRRRGRGRAAFKLGCGVRSRPAAPRESPARFRTSPSPVPVARWVLSGSFRAIASRRRSQE